MLSKMIDYYISYLLLSTFFFNGLYVLNKPKQSIRPSSA